MPDDTPPPETPPPPEILRDGERWRFDGDSLRADRAWDMQFLDLSAAGGGMTRQAATGENCLVIYEGCRVLHARMRPYAGRRYIGAYLHYAPADYASSPAVSHPRFWLPGSPSGLPEAG